MNAITFGGVESVIYQSVPDPRLEAPSDALVRMHVAGICGSDLHPYHGRELGLDVGTVMGHEFVGDVVEVGGEVTACHVGDLVVAPFSTSCGECFYCRTGLTARCERGQLFGWVQGGHGLQGAQAELIRVPLADGTLVRVPDALDGAVALLAGDILSTAAFGVDLAGVRSGDLVAVVGCGPVGLLVILAAIERGAREVVAVDQVTSRLQLAGRFGAVAVNLDDDPVAVVHDRSEGRGADAVVEAVGSPQATRLAADLLRSGGSLAAVGVHTEPQFALSPGEIYDRNLRYASGRCPARHYLPQSLDLARRRESRLQELISHRLPLGAGPEAYRRFAAREPGWTKVVLLPAS
jgi:threonine dehydrogenase-like Zn-dependent dehydrogenase